MHENRHFLSYRKRRHDAEIMCTYAHYVTPGSRCKMANSRVHTTGKKFHFESPRMKLRRHCQQLGLCLFPPCYFSSLARCVAFQSFSFCLLQFSQQARPHQGACLLLSVLFSQFILVCSVTCKNEKVLFVLVQQTSDFVASLGQGLGLGQLPVLAIHCFFSWLALLFLELYRSFTMYE